MYHKGFSSRKCSPLPPALQGRKFYWKNFWWGGCWATPVIIFWLVFTAVLSPYYYETRKIGPCKSSCFTFVLSGLRVQTQRDSQIFALLFIWKTKPKLENNVRSTNTSLRMAYSISLLFPKLRPYRTRNRKCIKM